MKRLFITLASALALCLTAGAQAPKEEVKPCIIIYCDTSNPYFGHAYDPKLLDTLIDSREEYHPAFDAYSLKWAKGFYSIGDVMKYYYYWMLPIEKRYRILRILKPKE